jgi:hypothetical protein
VLIEKNKKKKSHLYFQSGNKCPHNSIANLRRTYANTQVVNLTNLCVSHYPGITCRNSNCTITLSLRFHLYCLQTHICFLFSEFHRVLNVVFLFWIVLRRVDFNSQRFRTLLYLHRRESVKCGSIWEICGAGTGTQ